MGREGLSRRGVSEVVTTLLITTITLGTMVAAVFFAQQNLQMQAETTEFENGKASMLSLAQTIEGLTFAKGSSAYTRLAISSGGLFLTKGEERLTIMVNGETVFTDMVNLIRLRGGSGVASPQYVVLKGTPGGGSVDEHMRHLIVSQDDPVPLGWVYLKREKGIWVVVDFGRVRVVPSGAIRVTTDGVNWTTVNTVEITYVRIVWGGFSGSNTFDVCAKVTNVTTIVKKYAPSITVSVERGSYSKSYDVPSQADEATATLVFLNVVDVEVSVR